MGLDEDGDRVPLKVTSDGKLVLAIEPSSP